MLINFFFFFSSRRRHTRWNCDWSSDVCSSDLSSSSSSLSSSSSSYSSSSFTSSSNRSSTMEAFLEELSKWDQALEGDRKSTRLNSSHSSISYAVFCLKKKNYIERSTPRTDILP